MVEVRASADGGYSWGPWEQYTIEKTISPAEYALPVYRAGVIVQVRMYTIGDGSKRRSEASNTVTSVAMAEPVLLIQDFEAAPLYIHGEYKSHIMATAAITSSTLPQWFMNVWRKEAESSEWEYGWVGTAIDEKSYGGNSYDYKAACMTNNGMVSDFSAPKRVVLPAEVSNKLLPPTLFMPSNAWAYSDERQEYVHGMGCYVMLGDYRATVVEIEWQYNNDGVWHPYNEYGFKINYTVDNVTKVNEYHVYGLGLAIEYTMSQSPQPGDIIKIRTKNSAWNRYTHEGDPSLIDSDWSNVLQYVYPDYSQSQLAAPVVEAYQQWQTNYITITWNAITNASGYKIEKAITGQSEWRVLVASMTGTTYYDYDVAETVNYKYRVTALGDNVNYRDSRPSDEAIAYIEEDPDLDTPVIVSAVEVDPMYEAKITLVVDNIDAEANWIMLEYQKDGGSWQEYGMLGAAGTYVLAGPKIKFGGDFIFRCYAIAGATGQSEYSNTVQCTLKERVYFWDSTTDSDPSGLTGGWYSPDITDSEGTQYGGISISRQADGSMKTSGQGYWMTRNELTDANTGLYATYNYICMVGSLVKTTEGQNNFARFGNAFTYRFAGGINLDQLGGDYVIAGSEMGRGQIGTKTDKQLTHSACSRSSLANRIGAHIYFMLYGGSYAQYSAIFGIKR